MSAPRLLLVEDNPADVMLLEMAFQDTGTSADMEVCRDGEQAIEKIASQPPPDAVILDLNVPRRDGLEVLEAIRESASWKSVPVMVFTACFAPRDREQVAGFGAGFIRKPQSYSGFLDIATRLRALC